MAETFVSMYTENCIDSVIFSVLDLSLVDRGFQPWSDKTKGYKIGICCFCAKHTAFLRGKSKHWLTPNQDNVSKWSNISSHGL